MVAAAVIALALAAGAIRVLPLLLAPAVPAGLGRPLLRAALGVALETGLFVAPPLGWALAAARLVDRGEARALAALGVSPARLVASSWRWALVVVGAAALAALAWGREASAPGRLARELVAEARAACADGASGSGRAIDVPLVGVSWVCAPDATPRAVGPAPLSASRAVWAATALELSDDLRSLRADDLAIVAAAPDEGPSLRVRVGRATVRGLAPFGKASNLGAPTRAAVLGATAVLAAATAALWVLGARLASRPVAALVGLGAAASALLVFSALERDATPSLAYLAVPFAAIVAPTSVALAARAVRRR
jgi:hypothetical protein